MDELHDLRVIGLEVEQVKRINVVRLQPGPGVIEIAGDNGNGKSSLLDAIEMALGGEREIPWEPIRKGEQKAIIRLDLGNDDGLKLRLVRRMTARDAAEGGKPYTTSLTITDENGAKPRGAQTLLDTIVNGIAFDPELFVRLKPAEQADVLKGLVAYDFVAGEKLRREAYDGRTDVNRETKRLDGQLSGLAIPAGVTPERVDVEAITAALADIGEQARLYHVAKATLADEQRGVDSLRATAEKLRQEAKALRARAILLDESALDNDDAADEGSARIAALPPLVEPPSPDALRDSLAQAQEQNRLAERVEARDRLSAEIEANGQRVAVFQATIARLDKEAADALAAANLPVDGLALDGDRVTLRGVPFEQGSTAEKLRTSLAIGMALNPRLKVMVLRQGAMLDDGAWAILREVAAERGFQIFVESISVHGPDAIVMVDGSVKGAT